MQVRFPSTSLVVLLLSLIAFPHSNAYAASAADFKCRSGEDELVCIVRQGLILQILLNDTTKNFACLMMERNLVHNPTASVELELLFKRRSNIWTRL